jgi:MFS family permease
MSNPRKETASSSFAPFRSAPFAVLWLASVVSNIGSWMSNAASGWLMTSLDADPVVVALVQVMTSLPMFLFALPAGALSDIVDRRWLLIVVNAALVPVLLTFAALVWLGDMTPSILLAFTFVASTGGAFLAAPWQAIVPALVPRRDLAAAIAANSVGINISRAVGPALAGGLIAAWGIAVPFWLNAISFLAVVATLLWWRPQPVRSSSLPAERLVAAMRIGIRHARSSPRLQAPLVRAIAFFIFASAYWALLPLIARDRIAGGPALYGFLLGTIGVGAVVGALGLHRVRAMFGTDRVVTGGTIGTALTLVLFGVSHDLRVALLASLIAGVSWVAVLSSLNVAAQMALPDWVRGRGLALFVTAFFGAMTLGSVVWGLAASHLGLALTHLIAAAGALLTVPLVARWKLPTDEGVDLAPSMHWPAPVTGRAIDRDQGPVLVTVEYRTAPTDRDGFLVALTGLARQRMSSGAYDWGVYEDTAQPGRFVETFHIDSWLEHLRQHERVTQADRVLQEAVNRFDQTGAPKVTHLLAVRRPG